MSAYFNSTTLKYELLFEISEHQRLDRYMQGRYMQGRYWDGSKGCLIGCLAPQEHNRHKYLSEVYNVPELILQLGNSIFEGLNHGDSVQWPMKLLSSINEGQNLSQVWPKFAHWMLVGEVDGVVNLIEDHNLIKNISIIAESILSSAESSETAKRAARAAWAAGVADAADAAWAAWAAGVADAAWTAWEARAAWAAGVAEAAWEEFAEREAREVWAAEAVREAFAEREAREVWAAGAVMEEREAWAKKQADKLVEVIQGEQ